MHCTSCGRPLLSPAATRKTRYGIGNYGPVCAERLGLVVRVKRGPLVMGGHSRKTVDARQSDWIAEAT